MMMLIQGIIESADSRERWRGRLRERRERDGEGQTYRQTYRHTDRQTDRQWGSSVILICLELSLNLKKKGYYI